MIKSHLVFGKLKTVNQENKILYYPSHSNNNKRFIYTIYFYKIIVLLSISPKQCT